MKKLKENIFNLLAIVVLSAIVALGGLYGFLNKINVDKNLSGTQLFYVRTNTAGILTSNASSTRTYMSAGRATTTLQADAYTGGNNTGFLDLTLAVQLTATTGVPTLNIACEKSQDGLDWYSTDCFDNSTTTRTANISGAMNDYTWIFASSTCAVGGGAPLSNESVCERSFSVKPSTRFFRTVFTLASTTAVSQGAGKDNADLWAEFIGIKSN